MSQIEKPSWNRYDNIFELRHSMTEAQLYDEFKQTVAEANRLQQNKGQRLGPGIVHEHVGSFLAAIHKASQISLPFWKIVIPDLAKKPVGEIRLESGTVFALQCPILAQGEVGVIYYVAELVTEIQQPLSDNPRTTTAHVFRGTYGYGGTGPCESALIEWYVTEVRKGWFEIRNGDYLLQFFQRGAAQ